MDLMQLKIPPDRAALMADAVEHYYDSGDAQSHEADLLAILTWLRHRVAKWQAEHPVTMAT